MTDEEATGRRRTSKGIQSYARGARLAVVLQLFVAAAALAGTIAFIVIAQQKTDELTALNEQLKSGRENLGRLTSTTQDIAKTARMMASDPAEGASYAITTLTTTDNDLQTYAASLPAPPEDIGLLRASIARVLASAYSAQGDFAKAIEMQEKAVDPVKAGFLAAYAPDAADLAGDQVDLASYHCLSGNTARAAEIVTADFQEANPGAVADQDFLSACGGKLQIAKGGTRGGSFDRASADQAYVASTIYIMIGDENDRGPAIEMARSLCGVGSNATGPSPLTGSGPYSAPGIEVIKSRSTQTGGEGVIKYYYPAQAAEAASVAEQIAAAAGTLGLASWSTPMQQVQLPADDSLPRHQMEVWFRPGEFPPAAVPASKSFGCRSRTWIADTVQNLNDPSALARKSAGQDLADAIRKGPDAPIIDLLLKEIEDTARLDALSPSARVNVLTMLNVPAAWSNRPEKQRLTDALNKLDEREKSEGIAIGSQTRGIMNELRRKIGG